MDIQQNMDALSREPERIERPLIVVAIILSLVACAVYATPSNAQKVAQPFATRNTNAKSQPPLQNFTRARSEGNAAG